MTVTEAAQVIASLLRDEHLAVAESCTAGIVAQHLAAVPGSMDWFAGGGGSATDGASLGEVDRVLRPAVLDRLTARRRAPLDALVGFPEDLRRLRLRIVGAGALLLREQLVGAALDPLEISFGTLLRLTFHAGVVPHRSPPDTRCARRLRGAAYG